MSDLRIRQPPQPQWALGLQHNLGQKKIYGQKKESNAQKMEVRPRHLRLVTGWCLPYLNTVQTAGYMWSAQTQ